MKTSIMGRRAAALLLAVVFVAAGCNTATPTTTSPPTTVSDAMPFGSAADLLNANAPRIGIPAGFSGDIRRVTPEFEADYVAEVRDIDTSGQGVAIDWSDYTDDDLLFMGYLFCIGRDNGSTLEATLGAVAGAAAAVHGRPTDAPTTDDLATGVHVLNFSSSSLCGQFYLETQDFLTALVGGA